MGRFHPGVYIEEIPSGVQPIEGVSTSTAAFIGKTQMGPMNQAVLVRSQPEFATKFGDFLNDSFLAQSVLQFFNNGGTRTYIVRVAGAGFQAASITLKDRKTVPGKTLTIAASSPGAWGNELDVAITDGPLDPGNEFAITVFQSRSDQNPPLPPITLETISNLSMDPNASNFVEQVVKDTSKYITATVDTANQTTAVAGTSRSGQLAVGNCADLLKLGAANGGTETTGIAGPPATSGTSKSGDTPSTNTSADKRKFLINLDADGVREITIPASAATGADIAAAIQAAVRALTANAPAHQAAYDGFTASFQTPGGGAAPFYLLTSGTTGVNSSVVVTDSTATAFGPVNGPLSLQILVNGDGPHLITLNGAMADGGAVANAIQTAVRAILPKKSANQAAFNGFTAAYDASAAAGNPSLLLTSGTPGSGSSVQVLNAPANNGATLFKLGLTNTGIETIGGAILKPALSADPTQFHLGVATAPTASVDSVVFGADGALPGDLEHKNGLRALDTIRDLNLIAIPGIGTADVVSSGTSYCTLRGDCFFIGDVNRHDDTPDEAATFVNSLPFKSSYGALYYPWLLMTDPTSNSKTSIQMPPSGMMAGLYARIDNKRGVFKAPAGTEAGIAGVLGLVADTTDAQQDGLNPIGINVIRQFPASGIVTWGARTLGTLSDPEYRYIPVRRTAIFLEQSIYNGIQFAVFEPNDFPLWASLRLNITAFMMTQFRAGMFQGKSASDAFFVKVDETTTTQADIDLGIVNILVGFAPLKPAEFVVLKLTQKTGQPS